MLLLCLLIVLAPVNCQYLNVSEKVENIFSNPCTDKNHLVLAPGVLKSGAINRACVSRFHTDGPARLLLTLLTEDRLTTTASRELPPGDGGCLDISVPQLPNTKADLIVKILYPEVQCTWERRLTLRISSGRVLIVQTERVRYRLGDTVRARVLALKPDLAPSHGSIEEVWLEGPRGAWEGTRVAQWLRLRTRLGLGHLQYQLDTLAPPGKWTLRAKLEDGSQASAVFWVGNYELPPFQLSVRHAPRVLRTSERLVWTVCVRYPWSEAVEGILVIRLRGAGGGGAGVRTAVQLRAPKACHRHAIAAKRVGLHSQNPPEVLVADFSFQEEGTRIWQNTTVVSQVVEKPVTLEFLTKHRAVIARGLPYKLKVKATRWDDKPAVKEQVQVCRYPASAAITGAEGLEGGQAVTSHELCAEGETDSSGVARLMFAAVQGAAPFYRFQAQLKNDSTTTASLSVRVRSGAVQAALGPLKADSRNSRTLVPLYINVHVTTPLTVHFVVITRGGIIYRWGATTQCPTSNSADQIRTAPRNYKCNENYYAYNRDVMALRDNPHSSDDGISRHRSKRSFNSILEAESDPNAIQIDPTNISEKTKNISEITDKIGYNRINPDFDPNSILPSQNPTTKNLWNGSTELPIQEMRTSDTASTNIDQQYHRTRINPSPISLTANQSQKYHIILRNSLSHQKDLSRTTPMVTPALQYPSTQSRTTNMPTVSHQYRPNPSVPSDNHQHWSTNKPTDNHQYWSNNVPTANHQHWSTNKPTDNHQYWSNNVPTANHQHWSTNKPTDNHQYWSNNVPTANHQHWSTNKPTDNHQHWSTNIPTENHQHWSNLGNRVPTENHQHWPTPTHNDIRSEAVNVTAVTSDALLERKLKVMLPIKVSHQMCPDSHLIAYFYYNGELVSAAKHFEINECFANKVEASWLTRQAQPGSIVSLQVSSPGPALCALTVLDTAAKWVQPPPTTKEVLMNNLKRLIDSHRNLTEYDAAGECFLNSDAPDIPTSSIELTSSWLASAGVRMLGGEAPRAALRRCEAPPPAALHADEPAPRSDFSEAWLWRVLPVGSNGTGIASARAPDSITRFEAGVTCVSKSGVAVSPPAVLQVFREFFVHADGPRRLRRGDSALVRYRIFNYLYEPLSVQIQILTDPHISSSTDSTETACLSARSSIARRVRISASLAGAAQLRLRAKANGDGSCPNATTSTTVSDEVIIKMVIEPEGAPVHEQKSILLCGNDSAEHRELSTSRVEWQWPRVQAVPGTEALTLWTVGDMTGPLLADADSLVTIPRGCGEQNMAQLATNLLALRQLEPTSIAALIAREHVARGFTRQLQYVHPSGGFSAFGPSDMTSSTWLTAFAVKHLRKAHQLLWPNLQAPPALIRAERWLLSQQMENGCFRNEGQVFHRELRGGLNEDGEIASVALTAYVITSLIDSTAPISYRVLRNTLSCLRALPPLKSQTPTRVYAHALLAYAFMKVEKYEQDLRKTNNLNMLKNMDLEDDGVRQVYELLKVARRSNGYVWWEASSLSTSIEATSYALLAICAAPAHAQARGGAGDAVGALRWLAAHRSTTGGFVSTQDTLVALEALTVWSSLNSPFTHLNVTTRSDDRSQTVTLLPGVRIPDIMTLVPGEKLSVTVQGSGCALVQATRSYHTLTPSAAGTHDKQLSVQVAVHTDGPFDCDANRTTCFCAAVIEACVMWSGNFPEMALLEVSLPGGYGADAQLLYSQLNKPGSLLRRIELSPTNTRATLYLGARDGNAPARAGSHQCFLLHAVGPRAATRPAYARVLDYYVPEMNDTQLFTIPEDCPPRITHDSPQYTSSDNLFAKARSLDGDEILITHEFNFEDIPEGIPLEDPLYDNLTKREKEIDSEDIERYIAAEDKVLNTTDSIETENHNANDSQPQRNGNFDTFTLNNVEGIHISIPNIKTDSSHNIDTKQQHTDIKNIKPALVPNNNDRRIFENIRIPFDKIESRSTIKPIISEKLSLPTENKHIENPNLADFHIIDTDRDLDVPSGVEGPIPAVVLPPKNFVPPQHDSARVLKTAHTSRGAYMFFEPPQHENRRYFVPRTGRGLENYQHYKIRKNIR